MSFCKQRKGENIEVHIIEFGYCSRCAEISLWAEVSDETLVIFVVKITEGPHAWTAIFEHEFSDAWLMVSLFTNTRVLSIGVLCTQALRARRASHV